MSKFSLLTHCILIAIAIAIGILYIKPTVERIGVVEDKTALYKEESKKVSDVNQMLTQKLSIVDSVTPADKDNLLRYLPDSIDDISVMKDIVAMFTLVRVDVTDIAYKPAENKSDKDAAAVKGVIGHDFTLTATMQYDQLINVLRAIEINNYLLQVTALKITPDDVGQLKVDLVLTAFSKEPRTDLATAVVTP